MNLCFSVLLVLSLLVALLADGSEVQMSYSMDCGFEDVLSFTESFDGVNFFINENAVDQLEFCEAMEFYFASGCLLYRDEFHSKELTRIGEKYCSSGFNVNVHEQPSAFTVDSFRKKGRELLLRSSLNSFISDHPRRLNQQLKANFSRDVRWTDGKEKEHSGYPLTPKNMEIAASAMFLLCCGLVCPCFRAKRKDDTEKDSKELKRMDLMTSSFDLSSHSEKLPASPFRVPPSPLRVPQSPSRFSLSPQLSRTGSVHPNLDQIIKATQNFSQSYIIGDGGFGTVYKAQMPDGQFVAIKRAKKEQFATARAEFTSEVELLSKIEHRNLVRLLGCIDKGSELIIITEYVSNGTLREHLDGQHGKILNFDQRIEISIDVAHALTYLHLYAEKSIIHRDVKSSNILLTESFKAKVADFGFARAGPTDEDKTHISTKVKGTAGYLDPEYLKTYRLTTKSDVFSYGILLLEIISGRRPVEIKRSADERITIRWAFKKHSEGNSTDVLDPLLREDVQEEVLSKMLGLAFHCSAPTRADRPPMKLVVEKLWEIRKLYRSHRRE